jgi:hypothetical protein
MLDRFGKRKKIYAPETSGSIERERFASSSLIMYIDSPTKRELTQAVDIQ